MWRESNDVGIEPELPSYRDQNYGGTFLIPQNKNELRRKTIITVEGNGHEGKRWVKFTNN